MQYDEDVKELLSLKFHLCFLKALDGIRKFQQRWDLAKRAPAHEISGIDDEIF